MAPLTIQEDGFRKVCLIDGEHHEPLMASSIELFMQTPPQLRSINHTSRPHQTFDLSIQGLLEFQDMGSRQHRYGMVRNRCNGESWLCHPLCIVMSYVLVVLTSNCTVLSSHRLLGRVDAAVKTVTELKAQVHRNKSDIHAMYRLISDEFRAYEKAPRLRIRACERTSGRTLRACQ